MAIEFDCPVCTTTIRVPDSAAGRQGNCPRCDSTVEVPEVEPSTSQRKEPPRQSSPPPPPETPPDEPAVAPRPEWLKPRGDSSQEGRTDPAPAPQAGEPPGFVEAPPDGPPDFSALESGGDAPDAGTDETVAYVPDPDGSPRRGKRRKTSSTDEPPPSVPVDPDEPIPALGRERSPTARVKRRGRKSKKKRKRKLPPWLLPAVCVLALVGPVAYLWWLTRPRLSGSVEAQAYSVHFPEPRFVDPALAGGFESDLKAVSEALEAQPLAISSNLMRVDIGGEHGSLKIRVKEGRETRFVRVDLKELPDVRKFLKDEASRLGDRQRRRSKEALQSFVTQYQSQGGQLSHQKLPTIRDTLALNTLVEPLGFALVAVVGDKHYRAVYEDQQSVYFLLPEDVEEFSIEGRKTTRGRMVTANFDVRVAEVVEGRIVDEREPNGNESGGDASDDDPSMEPGETEEEVLGEPKEIELNPLGEDGNESGGRATLPPPPAGP